MIKKYAVLILFLLAGFAVVRVQAQLQCGINASVLSGCPPLVVNFSDNSTGNPTTHFWDFDNGNTSTNANSVATFVNSGIYNVKHIVSNGSQTDTCFQQIRVFVPATVNFSSTNNTGCVQPCHTVDFTNLTIPGESPVIQYVWDFGNGTPAVQAFNASHCFANTGVFDITLVVQDSNGCQTSRIVPDFVVIGNQPSVTASSAPSPVQSCTQPLVVNFSSNGNTPNGGGTYAWDFGNGGSSTTQNPTQVYFSGIYNAVVTFTDNFACIARDTILVEVTNMNAGFTVANTNACAGIATQFTDTSNFATSWQWNFGDGNVSTQQNPTHTYSSTGTYTVTLTVTYNNCTDTETKVNYITVTTPVTGNFTASDTAECSSPLTVDFISNTSGATSYSWDFGDGATSTQPNPTHTYTSNGSYTVSLTVTNSAGCANTITRNSLIDVGTLDASFTVDSTDGCTPMDVIFTNTTTSASAITSYQWDFGDGSTSSAANPTHIYNTAGNYTPNLIVQNAEGCVDTFVYPGTINVGQALVPSFTGTPVIQCVNQIITFTNTIVGVNPQTVFLWEFGDGTTSALPNPTKAYTDTGIFDISLTVINQGCPATVTLVDYIEIVVPKADFYFDYDCANPTFITFRDTSQGADTWFWDFGDGNTSTLQHPQHTYAVQGDYTVTLIVSNFTTGCVDSIKQDISAGIPQALFFADTLEGCAPFTVNFTDSSEFASSWRWLFGDGGTSTAQNPTYTYTDTGLYTVTLIVNPNQSCSDTAIRNQYIRVRGVKPAFSAPTVFCIPYTVNFLDSSTSYQGSVVAWQWSFDTGDSSTAQNPTYTYDSVSTYTVQLTVTDNNGCSASVTRNLQAREIISAFISDTAVCPGEPVNFTNQSTPANASQLWLFGDGNSSTVENPVHTYLNSGVYSVTLISFNNNPGCRDTLLVPNLVNVDTPVADFFVTTTFAPCPPFPVQFFNSTNRTDLNWLWYFGDGDTSTDRDPLHVYFFPGDYDVTLIAWDSSGCFDSITYVDLIRVRGPIGNFSATPDTGCVPLTVTFSGTLQTNVVSVLADLGDGTSYNDTVDITHTYQNVGNYYPIFTLTDSLGCVVSYPVDTIVVGLIPYPNLPDDTTVCKGNYVAFDLPLGDFFLWEANLSPTYLTCDTCKSTVSTAPDTITYYVTATTNIGCVARDTITVNVDALPQIFPGISFRICPGDTLQLSAGPNVTSAVWTPNMFIDDTNSVSPRVFPPDSMIYRVTGGNSTGCTISRIVRVNMIQKVQAQLNIGDTTICDGNGLQVDLQVLEASVLDTSFLWRPNSFINSDTIEDPFIQPPFGLYTYTVIVNSTNCEPDTESVNIQIAPNPYVEAGDDQTITAGTQVQIWAASPDDVTYAWTAPDPLSCTDCRRPVITANQTQTAYVVVTNQWGCTGTDSVFLRVVSCDPELIFVPNTFTPNGDGLNDLLYVRGLGIRKLEYFRIFDRWGKLVYESTELNSPWDGKINGREADVAVYVYALKGQCTNGSDIEKSGNVTLIR